MSRPSPVDPTRPIPPADQPARLDALEAAVRGRTSLVPEVGIVTMDRITKRPVVLETPDGEYYVGLDIASALHPQTLLCYEMNGEALDEEHGAPLRLRNEIELGFKQVKWIKGIEFVAHYSEIGSGYGGYNQDHEFFGYRQSI